MMRRLRRAVWLLSAALPVLAQAASLQVKVLDAAGAPLANAAVYAVPSAPSASATAPQATIDQVHRQFVPRVNVIQVGTAVSFPNSDNIRHSVYSFSPAKVFTLKLYSGKPSSPVVFDKPGVVVLGCDIHDSMVAFVLVVDTPYYARTDKSGLATLPDLPAGSYTLRAWHAPMQSEEDGVPLRVESSSPTPVTLRISADTNDVGAAASHDMADMGK